MIKRLYLLIDSSMIYYGLLIYISSFIFEGVIRYILHLLGIEYLIYFRDLILLLIILCYLIYSMTYYRINKVFLVVIFIMAFHTIVACFYVKNIFLIFFGWKIFLPLLCGILFGHLFITNIKSTNRVFLVLFLCAICGVFLNYFHEFPWAALEYKLGGFDIEGVRSWTFIDIMRLAGLSRTSFDAAIQILLLSIYLIYHLKNISLRIIIWVLAGPAILLTTTKGILITYVILTLFLLLYLSIPNYFKIYHKFLFIPFAIGIIMPIISNHIPLHNAPLILASFYDRILNSWPDALLMIQNNGNLFWGRGLGGIGTGQLFFEIQKYSAGDSIFVFAYGNFGLFGILYLYYFVMISQSLDLKSELFFYLLILSFLLYGIATTAFESSIYNLFLGTFMGYLHNQGLREYYKSEYVTS